MSFINRKYLLADIEQFIEEDELNGCVDGEGNVSLFSSIRFADDLSPEWEQVQVQNAPVDGANVLAGYSSLNNAELVHRRNLGRRPLSVPERGAEPQKCGWNEETSFLTSDKEPGDIDRNAISDLLYEGYRCMERLNADNAHISQLTKRVSLSRRRGGGVAAQSKARMEARIPVSDEKPCEGGEATKEVQLLPSYSTTEDDGFSNGHASVDGFSKENASNLDPSIRPVLCPLPGGVPFRHDPVKKFELYQAEWRRNPPPGEKRRLSLRWKVREYMLRQHVPRVTAEDLARKRRPNPEWVPKAYL
ncbi:hypothetical protein Tcan_14210 [Toxocara canis]|uniref:Centriolar and ciliogenesis-associated protein HYLS1 C-terminal domain-containing protein n=1 Tax=Toxocara canis TaxID=6265 RepID=A0A0B2VPH7_TOXCA|nr:hypothetical protein Tcan_14210 [Toxocara canis]